MVLYDYEKAGGYVQVLGRRYVQVGHKQSTKGIEASFTLHQAREMAGREHMNMGEVRKKNGSYANTYSQHNKYMSKRM